MKLYLLSVQDCFLSFKNMNSDTMLFNKVFENAIFELKGMGLLNNIKFHSKQEYLGTAGISGKEVDILKLDAYLKDKKKGYVMPDYSS